MRLSRQSVAQAFASLSPAKRRTLLVAGSLFVLCLLTVLTSHRAPIRPAMYKASQPATNVLTEFPSGPHPETDALIDRTARAEQVLTAPDTKSVAAGLYAMTAEPRIAYSAELAVNTHDFTHARSSMEEILERHRGYAARLRMVGQPSGSTLSATLKVPASEYPSTLADLKAIGNVERDEEAADEIVQQRGDIEARLQNAQNNERRLQLLLKDHDGKIIDLASIKWNCNGTVSIIASCSRTSISLSAKNTMLPSNLFPRSCVAPLAPVFPTQSAASPQSCSFS
jgi:Domain of unknown function (DUF4349)